MKRFSTNTVSILLPGALLLCATFAQTGCNRTCEKIAADRNDFLNRPPGVIAPHLVAFAPFRLLNKLIEPQISKLKPIKLKIPNLGKVSSYLGDLTLDPRSVVLIPARSGHVGFKLDFDILMNGKRAFSMFANTEVAPKIDLDQGTIELGFDAKTLKTVKPGMTDDARKQLGGLIYKNIGKLARSLIPRSLVDGAAGQVVEFVAASFYEISKDKLLKEIGARSKITFALPGIPLQKISLKSFDQKGGGLRLWVFTKLPVNRGIIEPGRIPPVLSSKDIHVRMSGSALAEIINWAMADGLLPSRYDDKGKAQPDGAFYPALDWVPGELPMKVYLWDLERPCMRINLGADPAIEVRDGNVSIKAGKTKVEDVEAAGLTEAGIWFSTLWRDALEFKKSLQKNIRLNVAGRSLNATIGQAKFETDELHMSLDIEIEKKD